jgi:four helix bundle protein
LRVDSLELREDMEKFEVFGFEKLLVYQKALDYVDLVYSLTCKFPKDEIFGLTSQFKRAANSIALNIGEGSGGTKNEFANFIRISYRSMEECVVCTTLAHRRKFINEKQLTESRAKLLEIAKMLSGLRKSIK